MDAPFIFINSFAIKEGKLKDFSQFLPEFFKAIEASEPRLLALNAYLNEDGTEVTFVQVHRDAASMAHEHTARALPFLDAITSMQVYGTPSDRVLSVARGHAQSGVSVSVNPKYLGGFTRLPAPALPADSVP